MQKRAFGRFRWLTVSVTTVLVAVPMVAFSPGNVAEAAVQVSLYASPTGSGSSCTRPAPCSIGQAKSSAAAAAAGSMTGDIEVVLLDGTYRLGAPLMFTAADSGNNGHQIIWRANTSAHPVISGGQQVAGWVHESTPNTNLWSAPANGMSTRQLYADGLRLRRSSGVSPVALTRVAGVGYTTTTPVPAYRNASSIEMIYGGGNGAWTEPRCGVAAISPNATTGGSTITMKQPCFGNLTPPKTPTAADGENPTGSFPGVWGLPTRMENVFEFLAPGQWYLDQAADRFYYYPRAGENPNTMSFEAATLEKLMTSSTTPAAPLRDVTFTGIEFAYATWLQPSGNKGFAEMQANMTMSESNTQGLCGYVTPSGSCPFAGYTPPLGAVDLSGTKNVSFLSDRFVHLGGAGLALHHGAAGDIIMGNEFTDISSNGVQLGSPDNPAPSSDTTNLALNTSASQSSTGFGGVASRAVDGNTDGVWANGSLSHTNSQAGAWWQTDLGASKYIDHIRIYNRTDGGYGNRLSDYYLFVSNSPFDTNLSPTAQASKAGVWSSHQTVQAGSPTIIPFNVKGRYVMVQLAGTNYLSLAEVQVRAGTDVLTENNTISNNWVHATGAEYTGAVGIEVAHARGTTITHNQINDLPYSGISLGWGGWHSNGSFEDTNPTLTADNVISYNLLYKTMKRRYDGGPIYTNGSQGTSVDHGLTIQGNVTFGNARTNNAFYGDEGARYVRLIDNVQYDDPGHFNGGCGDVGPVDVTGSYYTGAINYRGCGSPFPERFTQSNNTLIAQDPDPDAVPQALLQAAGLEASYRSLTTSLPPEIAWVSPVKNNQILVAGSGFTSDAVVHFAGTPATAVQVLSSEYLLVTVPIGANPGTLTVNTPAGSTVTNLAQGRPASQSSTYQAGYEASKAVDGSTSSLAHTQTQAQPWWQVDLGASYDLSAVNVFNRTDGWQDRLSDYYVFVSDDPFDSALTTAQRAAQPGVWSSLQTGPAGTPSTVTLPPGIQGRYVMVQLNGTNYLNLAEVQVLQRSNMALGRTATQSSTYGSMVAARAVDGNTDGDYTHGSLSHTNNDAQAWWTVDLGASQPVGQIKVYNRSDGWQDRLSNYYVFVSESPFDTNLTAAQQAAKPGVWASLQTGTAGRPTVIAANTTGRYVMVQLVGTNYLALAELQVFGQ